MTGEQFWYLMAGLFGSGLLFVLVWIGSRLTKILDRLDKTANLHSTQLALHEKAIDDLEQHVFPVNYKARRK